MRVLVACEFSGVVRSAFRNRGHAAWSCDILPAQDGSAYHIQRDVRGALADDDGKPCWDLMIAHPPCTHLSVSGARWFKDKIQEQAAAIDFVRHLLAAPIERICLENPVSVISTKIRKPNQIIQPYNFGDPFKKTTCLWLKNLPKLTHTSDMTTGEQACWKEPPGPDRWKKRSRTYQGIANAMAGQWGDLCS